MNEDRLRRRDERRRAAATLGAALIGLPGDIAYQRAEEAGFDPVLIGPEVQVLTLDLRPNRLRLLLDEDGVVKTLVPG